MPTPLARLWILLPVKAEPRKQPDPLTPAYDPNAHVPDSGTSCGEKHKEDMGDAPSPLLVLAKGLSPMPDGDVLHPFSPQHHLWMICGSSRIKAGHFGS